MGYRDMTSKSGCLCYQRGERRSHSSPLINKSTNRTPPETSAIQTRLLALKETHCVQASEENMPIS